MRRIVLNITQQARQFGAHLRSGDVGSAAITHRTDLQAQLLFEIALTEELVHDAIRPHAVQSQRLGGIGQIRAVDEILENLQRNRQHNSAFLYRLCDPEEVVFDVSRKDCCLNVYR